MELPQVTVQQEQQSDLIFANLSSEKSKKKKITNTLQQPVSQIMMTPEELKTICQVKTVKKPVKIHCNNHRYVHDDKQ